MRGKKKIFLETLKKQLGVVTATAKETGISRMAHYKWMATDPEYKLEVDKIDDLVLDFAENSLFKLMMEKNVASIIFFLKCKGKKRGYVEKQELELSSGQSPIIIEEYVYDKDKGSIKQQTEGSTKYTERQKDN